MVARGPGNGREKEKGAVKIAAENRARIQRRNGSAGTFLGKKVPTPSQNLSEGKKYKQEFSEGFERRTIAENVTLERRANPRHRRGRRPRRPEIMDGRHISDAFYRRANTPNL